MAETAREISHHAFGEDHSPTLELAGTLAACHRARGEFDRGRGLDEDTLSRRRLVLGESHPSTLASAGHLALDLRGLGLADEAREVEARARGGDSA